MKILINTPLLDGVRTGNRSSADQWAAIFSELGHEVEVASNYSGQDVDWLVGLHAAKSAAAVAACREVHPQIKIAVVMTGTDIYPEPSAGALESMRQADVLVGLQPSAVEQVPDDLKGKVQVIVQASLAGERSRSKSLDPFDVCVIGHLRDVKDPMLTAAASRLLPASSKIRVRHAGAILDPKYVAMVEREQLENSRYEWLGQLGMEEVRELTATSQILVLTSLSEGAGRVIGSAISKHTPVLSTAIHGVIGLVGDDYPGLFPVGDTRALADLLLRVESDVSFLHRLATACDDRAYLFEPERELAGWRDLLEGKSTQ